MDRDRFWALIDSANTSDDRSSGLRLLLTELSLEEITSFQEHFDLLFGDAYTWKLWGAAYLINGGCSDDAFIDFRYGLISRGRKIYEAVVENPDTLADLAVEPYELDDEAFGYVAMEVYEEKSGEYIPRKHAAHGDAKGEEWDFDDDDLSKEQLPKLFAKYGDS